MAVFVSNGRREQHAARQGHGTTIEVTSKGEAYKAGTAIAERAVIPARQPGTPGLQRRGVWPEVGLTVATHVLRNRRVRQTLTVGVLTIGALAYTGWRVLARTVSDLTAWDNARLADLEKQPHGQRIAQAADGAILDGAVIEPRQAGASSRQHNAVWLGIGLVAAKRALRNRRLDEQVVLAIFAAATLAEMDRKELLRAFMDLIAWDNTRLAGLSRQLRRERQVKAR